MALERQEQLTTVNDETELDDLATLFKALAHPNRLAILETLRGTERCVCEIEDALGLRQAYVSQQLTVLREAGLVCYRRDGWNVYYRIARPEVYSLLALAAVIHGNLGTCAIYDPSSTCGSANGCDGQARETATAPPGEDRQR